LQEINNYKGDVTSSGTMYMPSLMKVGLFVCSLSDDAIINSDHMGPIDWMILNNKLGRIWMKAAVA
jgi:hypothetical protein